MRTLLFRGASVSQLPAITHARSAGYRVVAVDGDRQAVAFAQAHIAEVVSFTDVERVTELARGFHVDGVLAVSTDRAVVPAAAVATALGLPGIGVETATRFTNKVSMRSRLAEEGVPQPRWRVLRSTEDVEDALTTLTPPLVLKPADSGGQRGLFLLNRTGSGRQGSGSELVGSTRFPLPSIRQRSTRRAMWPSPPYARSACGTESRFRS